MMMMMTTTTKDSTIDLGAHPVRKIILRIRRQLQKVQNLCCIIRSTIFPLSTQTYISQEKPKVEVKE